MRCSEIIDVKQSKLIIWESFKKFSIYKLFDFLLYKCMHHLYSDFPISDISWLGTMILLLLSSKSMLEEGVQVWKQINGNT